MDKSEIINRIIAETGSESYLEIGYGNGYNFKQIKCKSKLSCDPDTKNHEALKMTSDEFFEAHKDNVFECVFIDGLHHADQVRKDIINSMKCNAKAIILHDTIPPTQAHQIVPRKQTSWTGDVYKAAVGFRMKYPDIKMETYRSDYGITVLYPEGKKVRSHFEKECKLTYEEFKENEVELLRIID